MRNDPPCLKRRLLLTSAYRCFNIHFICDASSLTRRRKKPLISVTPGRFRAMVKAAEAVLGFPYGPRPSLSRVPRLYGQASGLQIRTWPQASFCERMIASLLRHRKDALCAVFGGAYL